MEGKRPVFVGVALVLIVGALIYSFYRNQSPARITLDVPDGITAGQEISVPLRLSTRETMNAAEFYFNFSNDLLEVVRIDTAGSFYQLWVTGSPKFNNTTGELSFEGGLPTPGFSGNDGLVATVIFTAKTSGSGQITLDETKSRVLANDGTGTKIEATFRPITVRVRP
ncbi:MAG: cohesin domain-containing protein [Patescibacteria group bacterium]